MTPSMLSQIENNGANPSINTLKNLAAALEVPMFKFFQTDRISESLIVRKGNYMQLGSARDGVFYVLLTPDLSGTIEFCMMEIPPESVTAASEKAHTGEEVAYVVQGNVFIHMNEKTFELYEGDSVRIPAGTNHLWENKEKTKVKVIFAITPPSF